MAIIENTQFGRVKGFRFWCQKVLPAVYDDSLSYYELLCKFTHWLEELTELTNTQSDAISELQTTMQNFIDGEITPYIIETIDQWFQDNEPSIVQAIEDLQNAIQALDDSTDERLDALENDVAYLQNRSLFGLKIVVISDSYGRGVGAIDDNGFPYYLENHIHPYYMLNVSNSGAGFIASGHSANLENLNFQGQIDYAYNNLDENIYPEDIDILIIAGGYNDHALSGQATAAANTVAHAHEKFPNAKIVFFPLCVGDRELNAEYYRSYSELSWGCARGGAEVHPEAMYWLYPYELTTSYGDGIHPNATGYLYIADYMGGCIMGGNMFANTSALGAAAEGFSIESGVTNIDFRCGVQNGMAFYGGSVKKTGDDVLLTLPSYCRPAQTTYVLAFAYADSTHHSIFRVRILSNGEMSAYIPETGDFDNTLEYTYWIPDTVLPLGNILG